MSRTCIAFAQLYRLCYLKISILGRQILMLFFQRCNFLIARIYCLLQGCATLLQLLVLQYQLAHSRLQTA